MKNAVIVAYGRSACCRARKGGLSGMNPVDYAAQTLRGVLARAPGLRPELIDDVITGCAMPINELSMNTSRLIINRAGLPDSVCGQTINRFCASGLQALATAGNAIAVGQLRCVVAGGVECMTRCFAPYPDEYKNGWLLENYIGAYMSMGETAERVAERFSVSREEMERLALESHVKAAAARRDGKLAPSIVPVINEKGETVLTDDGILAEADGTMRTSLEKMAGMRPCFREDGRVTAATSSQTTDAAAYAVVLEETLADELGLVPLARLVGFSVAGCDATLMGLGPVFAIPKVMEQTGLSVADMDVIELNEAFAAQALVCMRELGLPRDKINPYGGAMALGHPMGATGVVLTGKALDYLREEGGKYALVSMCIGGGMGAAGILELL